MTVSRSRARSVWRAWLAGSLVLCATTMSVAADATPASSNAALRPVSDGCADEVGEAVVKFRDSVSTNAIANVHAKLGAQVVGNIEGTHTQWVRARGYTDDALLAAYRGRPEVEWVKPAPNRMEQSSQ